MDPMWLIFFHDNISLEKYSYLLNYANLQISSSIIKEVIIVVANHIRTNPYNFIG